ncbi:retinoblastoma-associated protein rb -related [Anaeramoeba flamelloides]|uniref:Retinoblastoma-associated protein rb -related n=1 Tax=Anaeramoeba flamelloides TaxID=1746091 RepID=A0AAV7ZQA0_9EUKA|nr:retinoblastoma-associated protein rb -related [Anaeramoeba flamelloides]
METEMEKKNMINSLPMLNLGLERDFINENEMFDSEHDGKEKKKEIEKGEERREKKNFIYSGIFEKNLSQNFMRISREYETLIGVDDLFDNRIFLKNKDKYNKNKIVRRKKVTKRKEKEKSKKGKKTRKNSNIKIENFKNKMKIINKRKSKVKDNTKTMPKINNKLKKHEFYNVLNTLPEQIPPELINYFKKFNNISVLLKLIQLLKNSLPIPFHDNISIDHNDSNTSTNAINLDNTLINNIEMDNNNTTTTNNNSGEMIFKNDQKAINNSFNINYSKLNEYEQIVLKLFWYALVQIISKEKKQETKENKSPNVSDNQNESTMNAKVQDTSNKRKKSKFSIQTIFYPFLENEEFYQTLICCCFEIVIYQSKNKKLQFPAILKLFNLSCFEFSKILPVVIPSFQILPNLLINHLIEIQTDIISKHIWEKDSKFLQIFKKIPDENKIELIRNLTADLPKISDGFANILYSHLNIAKERIQLLLQKLNYGNDNVIFYQIWNTYLYLLFFNNSLDQIISHYKKMDWKLVNFSFINNKNNNYDNDNDLGGVDNDNDNDNDNDDDNDDDDYNDDQKMEKKKKKQISLM